MNGNGRSTLGRPASPPRGLARGVRPGGWGGVRPAIKRGECTVKVTNSIRMQLIALGTGGGVVGHGTKPWTCTVLGTKQRVWVLGCELAERAERTVSNRRQCIHSAQRATHSSTAHTAALTHADGELGWTLVNPSNSGILAL